MCINQIYFCKICFCVIKEKKEKYEIKRKRKKGKKRDRKRKKATPNRISLSPPLNEFSHVTLRLKLLMTRSVPRSIPAPELSPRHPLPSNTILSHPIFPVKSYPRPSISFSPCRALPSSQDYADMCTPCSVPFFSTPSLSNYMLIHLFSPSLSHSILVYLLYLVKFHPYPLFSCQILSLLHSPIH